MEAPTAQERAIGNIERHKQRQERASRKNKQCWDAEGGCLSRISGMHECKVGSVPEHMRQPESFKSAFVIFLRRLYPPTDNNIILDKSLPCSLKKITDGCNEEIVAVNAREC